MNKNFKKFFPRSLKTFIVGVKNGYERYCLKYKSFGYIALSAKLDAPIQISNYKNVFVGENSHIGPHSTILTTNAKFILKRQSGSAGNLTIVTGNHARIPGVFYRCITNDIKPHGLDKDVVVNEDVWMGLNVTILSGVEIGRGCTIAAGAVVTKSMPPYAIVAGVPAKVIKIYWTIDEILKHEERLYEENERFTRGELEGIFAKYKKA